MRLIMSFSALVIGCAVPATAHAQSSAPATGPGQREAVAQDHAQHQAGQGGAGQHGADTSSSAPHQMGMKDCKCCCCEAMRRKMQEHGEGAAGDAQH